jgi:hypothetical protein
MRSIVRCGAPQSRDPFFSRDGERGPWISSAPRRNCGALRRIRGTRLALLALETKKGKSAKSCQAPFAKIFLFFRMANQR